jgi:ABC-type sugar transport system permease subunit
VARPGSLLRRLKGSVISYVFLLPSLAAFSVFVFIPFVWNFVLTFQKGGLFRHSYAGLYNYGKVLSDGLFLLTLKNTFLYVVFAVPGVLVISFVLALCLNRSSRFHELFKSILFFPLLSPVVVISLIWLPMFHPEGVLNRFLGLFGLPSQNWLGNPNLALVSIAIVEIWRGAGFYIVVLLGGLQRMPQELFEAAELEGAGSWGRFFYLTLPLMRPILLFCLVMATIWNFQIFDSVFILTNGGPANHSSTSVWYIYRTAFSYDSVGYASTMATFLLFIILFFAIVQFRFLRSRVEY